MYIYAQEYIWCEVNINLFVQYSCLHYIYIYVCTTKGKDWMHFKAALEVKTRVLFSDQNKMNIFYILHRNDSIQSGIIFFKYSFDLQQWFILVLSMNRTRVLRTVFTHGYRHPVYNVFNNNINTYSIIISHLMSIFWYKHYLFR